MAAQYAAALWSATLGNQVPIAVRVEFIDLDCSGGTAVLGSSGPSAALRRQTATRRRWPTSRPGATSTRAARRSTPASTPASAGSDCAVTAWYPGLDNARPARHHRPRLGLPPRARPRPGLHQVVHAPSGIARPDDTSGLLLSQLSATDYDAAIRRPVRTSAGSVPRCARRRTRSSTAPTGCCGSPTAAPSPSPGLASARRTSASTAPLVLAQDADGGTAHRRLPARSPRRPGALVLAERRLRTDAGLFCLVAQRALNAQAAGAVGLLVRPAQCPAPAPPRTPATPAPGSPSRCGASPPTTGRRWSRRSTQAPRPSRRRRRAGARARTSPATCCSTRPSAYSEGSSVGHWDSSASPPLLMDAHHQPPPPPEPGPHPGGAAGRGLVPARPG